jgi:ubiquinone/menaquinone biosynthesis C-methylase UbiE
MLNAVGDVGGLRVIDLGCGEGRFSRMLAERGAKVTGVDFCEQFIESASSQKLRDEEYVYGDMTDLHQFGDSTFDLAVSYITLVDVPDFRAAISEAHRVLKPGGRFVICNSHSMTTAGNGWIKFQNERLHFKLDNYFDEGVRVLITPKYSLTNFHRTLSSYVNAFLEAGFVLEGIREPMPSKEQAEQFPEVADNHRVPNFIIYLLRKPIQRS